MNTTKKVIEFNKAFKLEINDKPTLINKDNSWLGYELMREELEEYGDALINKDLIEVVDAIVDMQYVLDGLKAKHGIAGECFNELFNEVHASNMSKLVDGKPTYREDGKVLKGKDYFRPNLKPTLEKYTNQISILEQK